MASKHTRRSATIDGERLRWAERNGYISGARCPIDHGGNRGMVRDGAYAQCQGCGSHRDLRAAIAQAEGE